VGWAGAALVCSHLSGRAEPRTRSLAVRAVPPTRTAERRPYAGWLLERPRASQPGVGAARLGKSHGRTLAKAPPALRRRRHRCTARGGRGAIKIETTGDWDQLDAAAERRTRIGPDD